MKHAGAETLDAIGSLLERIRRFEGLREKSIGVFYRKGKAFLHFHEDPAGLFADLRREAEWIRLPADSEDERIALLGAVADALEL